MGVGTLYKNTTGYLNTASGAEALYSNTTGYANVATGDFKFIILTQQAPAM